MLKKEFYFNWLFTFSICIIFAFNYFYLFSEDFSKDKKINDLEVELESWENANFELTEEILKLRIQMEKALERNVQNNKL
jgi:hypothetical protein